jgi:hypothetical protein
MTDLVLDLLINSIMMPNIYQNNFFFCNEEFKCDSIGNIYRN